MKDNSRYLPREDYKELLTLNLIFLGGIPPLGVRFRVPGAYHHARWMSKIIFIMKIYLFRHQFKLTKHETDASTWQQTPSFQKATAVVSSLKVVNDCAERGIALASSFN